MDVNDTDFCVSRVPLFLVSSRRICFRVYRMDSTYCVEYVRADIAGNQVFGKKGNVYDRLAVTVGRHSDYIRNTYGCNGDSEHNDGSIFRIRIDGAYIYYIFIRRLSIFRYEWTSDLNLDDFSVGIAIKLRQSGKHPGRVSSII